MQISAMTEEDIKELALLEKLCFSDPWSEEALRGELSNPQAIFLVARQGGAVLGYGGMYRVLGEGYVANLAVFPQFRRRGAARRLLEALYSQTDNYLTLEVRAGNSPALTLYRCMGFRQVGRRRNFYQHPSEDALIMTKSKEE